MNEMAPITATPRVASIAVATTTSSRVSPSRTPRRTAELRASRAIMGSLVALGPVDIGFSVGDAVRAVGDDEVEGVGAGGVVLEGAIPAVLGNAGKDVLVDQRLESHDGGRVRAV